MIIQSVLDIVHGYLIKFRPDEQYLKSNLESHRTICAALRAKDLEGARACLREHLGVVNQKLQEFSQKTIPEADGDPLAREA
jgi:DNA-binding FadR family transcriptional regulator